MKTKLTLFAIAFSLICLPALYAGDTPQTTTADKPADDASKSEMKAPGCAAACKSGPHADLMSGCCKGMETACNQMKKDSDDANGRLDMLLTAAKKDKAGKATIALLEELVAQQKAMNENLCAQKTNCMQTRNHMMMGLMCGMDNCCKTKGDAAAKECPMHKDGEKPGCPMMKQGDKPADKPADEPAKK